MNEHFLEKNQVVSGFVPVAMEGGANSGALVSMKNFHRMAIVFFKAVGTAGEDPVLTITQAQDAAGTGEKALNFTRVDVKEGTLATIGQFTTVTQAAGNTYSNATLAEKQAIIVVDIVAEMLDMDNDFDFIRAAVGDVGIAAQVGALLYIGHEPRYGAVPMPSAIA